MLSWAGISLLSACSPIQHIPDAAIIRAPLDQGGGYLWYVGRHKGWGIWTEVSHSWEIERSQQTEVLAQQEWKVYLLLRSFTDPTRPQFICARTPRGDWRQAAGGGGGGRGYPAVMWGFLIVTFFFLIRAVFTPAWVAVEWQKLEFEGCSSVLRGELKRKPSQSWPTILQPSSHTWSSLLVCRRRCLKKSRREHFLTRMRSVLPSARWAEGERPLGLRGHAQLIQAALMPMNLPWITLQPWPSSARRELRHIMLISTRGLKHFVRLSEVAKHVLHSEKQEWNQKVFLIQLVSSKAEFTSD